MRLYGQQVHFTHVAGKLQNDLEHLVVTENKDTVKTESNMLK